MIASKYRGIKYRGNCDNDENAVDSHCDNSSVSDLLANRSTI